MRHWTIRQRLTVWASALMGLSLSAFAIGVTYHLWTESMRGIDHRLQQVADRVADAMDRGTFPGNERTLPEDLAAHAPERIWVRVLGADGKTLFTSPGFPRLQPKPASGGVPETVVSHRGTEFRLFAMLHQGRVIEAVSSLEEVDEVVEDLLISFAVALPLSLGVLFLGGYLLANRALRPVAKITGTARRITAENLGERLPAPESRDEIAELTRVLNEMIDRLERGFEQGRRFTADASHQIKTPLTIMRGEIEAMLKRDRADEAALLRVLEEVDRLSAMTGKLLFLSRADAGHLALSWEECSLAALLRELAEDFAALAEVQGITVSCSVDGEMSLWGDRSLLRQLFGNLLENALKYNRPGGSITLAASESSGRAIVDIANSGEGIPPERQRLLFQRFYTTSSRQAGHGLGLNIAREIASLHGGSLVLERSGADRTEFRVTLPSRQK